MAKAKITRAKKTKAKFKKFCPDCIFLTNYNKLDLYFCPSGKHKAPYIIRYGDRKENFVSGSGDNTLFPELQVAKMEAEEQRCHGH